MTVAELIMKLQSEVAKQPSAAQMRVVLKIATDEDFTATAKYFSSVWAALPWEDDDECFVVIEGEEGS